MATYNITKKNKKRILAKKNRYIYIKRYEPWDRTRRSTKVGAGKNSRMKLGMMDASPYLGYNAAPFF